MSYKPSSTQADRARVFKKLSNHEETRRKRVENMVQIRKTARTEQLEKRRREDEEESSMVDVSIPQSQVGIHIPQATFDFTISPAVTPSDPAQMSQPENETRLIDPTLTHSHLNSAKIKKSLEEWTAQAWSDGEGTYEAVKHFRKILSKKIKPPIDQVIETGILPRFVQVLQNPQVDSRVRLEAAWALTNVTSGTSQQTQAALDVGAAPVLIQVLQSFLGQPDACAHEDLREQCVWALGNVAGDSAQLRDMLISLGAVPAVVGQLNSATVGVGMIRQVAWALSNFCRRKAPYEVVAPLLPALAALLGQQDLQTSADATWALSYVTDGVRPELVQAVCQSVPLAALANLLVPPPAPSSTTSPTSQTPAPSKAVMPALRTLGNIVSGTDEQTSLVIASGTLPNLNRLLCVPQRRALKKEACWLISNIAAGTPEQIQALVQHDLFATMVWLLETSEFEVRREACWAVANALSNGTTEQVATLVSMGVVPPLCRMLDSQDSKLVLATLEGLNGVLNAGAALAGVNGVNTYESLIEEAEGLDKIEMLQSHADTEVYDKAMHILETFFGFEDENDGDMALAPEVDNTNSGSTYVFKTVDTPAEGFNFS